MATVKEQAAGVSGYFNLQEFVAFNPMIDDEQRDYLFALSNAAKQKYFQTGEAERSELLYSAFESDNEDTFSQDVHDYYFSRVASCWPNFSRNLTLFSIEKLAQHNALTFAPFITTPFLGVVGENAPTRGLTEQFIEQKGHSVSELKEIKGGCHLQSYDRDEHVNEAISAITDFFEKQLVKWKGYV